MKILVSDADRQNSLRTYLHNQKTARGTVCSTPAERAT